MARTLGPAGGLRKGEAPAFEPQNESARITAADTMGAKPMATAQGQTTLVVIQRLSLAARGGGVQSIKQCDSLNPPPFRGTVEFGSGLRHPGMTQRNSHPAVIVPGPHSKPSEISRGPARRITRARTRWQNPSFSAAGIRPHLWRSRPSGPPRSRRPDRWRTEEVRGSRRSCRRRARP